MCILPRAIYRFSLTPIEMPIVFFAELEKIILKFVLVEYFRIPLSGITSTSSHKISKNNTL